MEKNITSTSLNEASIILTKPFTIYKNVTCSCKKSKVVKFKDSHHEIPLMSFQGIKWLQLIPTYYLISG